MTRWLPLLCFVVACSSPPPPGSDDAGGTPEDAGRDAGRPDAGPPVLPGCIEQNNDDSVASRGGFYDLCVDAGQFPAAQCGDGSPLKLSWRDSPDGGTAVFLYFRGVGRCSDYIGCWGRDGKGGQDRSVSGLSNTERTSPRVATFGFTAHGLFNPKEPGNVLADFNVVHVPDCTGDLGARDEVVDLQKPANANVTAPAAVRTYFRGARDVEAAVELARARYPSPSRVVLGGTGEGAYFALAALPRVDAAWPGVPLTVLFDGEAGAGDTALDGKFRAALSAFDGQGGRRLARFVSLSFVSDPIQRAASGSSALLFQSQQEQALKGREAAAPATFRWFAPAMACHAVAQTPGLWARYVPWGGGLRPQQPPGRPNMDLAVMDGGADGGVDAGVVVGVLEPWLYDALSTTGAYAPSFTSVGADFGTVSMECTLPESLER